MQRRRAGLTAATAITVSTALLASCNAIFGISGGTAGELPDADTDAPSPADAVLADASIVPDGTSPDGIVDGPALDAGGDASTPDGAAVCEPDGDEDGDAVLNSSDSCPHLIAADTDTDSDGVGDACDPFAGTDSVASFIGFEGSNAPCGWSATGPWQFVGGEARLSAEGAGPNTILRDATTPSSRSMEVAAAVDPASGLRASDWFGVVSNGTSETLECWFVKGDDLQMPVVPDKLELRLDGALVAGMDLAKVRQPRLTLSTDASGMSLCTVHDALVLRGSAGASFTPEARRPGVVLPRSTPIEVRYVWVVEQP